MVRKTTTKYLNNKDMLKEIHQSKLSYCSAIDDAYTSFDIIVDSVEEITPENIQAAKENQASRLSSLGYEGGISGWHDTDGTRTNKPKQADFRVDPSNIPVEDLVFRVMTYSHIPEAPGRKRNPKTEADLYNRLNFPPFKHYAFIDNEWREVLRSHWEGGIGNGNFCMDQGKLTPELARMMMKLVERYAMRGNWRGYCVDEETEALTQRGWLNIDNITTDDKIMSYENGEMKWSTIKSIFKDDFDGLMHKITTKTGIDMLVTPGHKLVTERGLIRAEYLLENDRIVLMGSEVAGPDEKEHTDAFVELTGWILTEGNYEYDHTGIKNIRIYQNPGKYADRIRKCLDTLGYEYSENASKKTNLCFTIFKKYSKVFHKTVPIKNLSMEFILSLTSDQRHLLIETMIDGDGWRRGHLKSYCQKDREHIDLFQALCVLTGQRSNFKLNDIISFGKPTTCHTMHIFSPRKNYTRGECLDFHGGKNNGRNHIGKGKVTHPNFPTSHYKGKVWCPETEYGCFMARRNGSVYLTGNTYNDEMQSAALLQLSEVGLKFNEARSSNPFAYYTATITNSFTRVLNLEKRNQHIRDDILQDGGYMPSFSRQLDDEAAQQQARDEDNMEKGQQELRDRGYNII